MKYFDTFTGIGGFTKGILDIMPDAECVGFSEIDKYAIQTYQKHYPNHKNYGDITTIDTTTLPHFDLLVGGSPCQSFSVAGQRGGFNDTRGTLFFEYARILKDKQPRYFIFENVKGLLSHDGGRTFVTILKTLSEIGYDYQWQVLNSKNFGVPQNRERIYIVGNLRTQPRPKVFPITGTNKQNTDAGSPQTANTLTANYHKGPASSRPMIGLKQIGTIGKDSEATRVYDPEGVSRTIKNGGGMGAKTGLYQTDYSKIRRLTPLECERLQGFPDNWTAGISDTQRYKQCGNAVTVNVVREIIKKLI